ncbi:MAG: ORF6N domain-containing protein [Prosthecobacter sp.]|uniref:ORF6N domain-containing protein n=1 Tax=Prosthecobacter sp. TaxID=1965333 RepID=UPI0039025388
MKAPAIHQLILILRGERVILDSDLAALYGVPTKRLNEQVKRNADRFPEDFAFRLTGAEKLEVVANCDHLSRLKYSAQPPMAFTEHGAIMAATVLNSPEAVAMSVFVVRAFIQMREQLAIGAKVLQRLAEIDHTLLKHDQALNLIWQQLQPLLAPPPAPPKRKIGFQP